MKQHRHASVLGNAMVGKDTLDNAMLGKDLAFGAESDLWDQLLGQGKAL